MLHEHVTGNRLQNFSWKRSDYLAYNIFASRTQLGRFPLALLSENADRSCPQYVGF
jgi:hypothetical protein